MKLIKIMLLLVSFFAIAGAAMFQLFILLTNALFFQHDYSNHNSHLG